MWGGVHGKIVIQLCHELESNWEKAFNGLIESGFLSTNNLPKSINKTDND